jgi:hypothetical protein
MSGSCVAKCMCKHEYQDKRYGLGRRLMNYTAKGEGRCTACGSLNREIPPVTIKPKKNGGGSGGGAKTMVVYPPPGGWPGGRPEDNGYKHIGGK